MLNENEYKNSMASLNSSLFQDYLANFTLLLIFMGVCHGAGKYNAEQENEFYAFNYGGQDYILISSYGDYFIASKAGDEMQITKEFSVFNPSQQFISGLKKAEINIK